MSFEMRSTNDIVRILLSGGGLSLNGQMRMTDELVRMALAARQSGASFTISGMAMRSTDEIVRIALAGGGRVTFE